jgi:hypothetical protein
MARIGIALVLLVGAGIYALTSPSVSSAGDLLPSKAKAASARAPLKPAEFHKPAELRKPDRSSKRYRDASGRFMEDAFNADLAAWQSRMNRKTSQINAKQHELSQEESKLKGLQGRVGGAMKADNRTRQGALDRERESQEQDTRATAENMSTNPVRLDSSRLMGEFIALGVEDPNSDAESQAAIAAAQAEVQRAKEREAKKKDAE